MLAIRLPFDLETRLENSLKPLAEPKPSMPVKPLWPT
jgi:hypothetical protein